MGQLGDWTRHSLMRAASHLPHRLLDAAARRWPGDAELFTGFWIDAHYWRWARRHYGR